MSTLAISYGDLDDAADYAKKLASELEDYADRLESKVSRKISSYSGDRTQNIYDADGFMRKKLVKLRQKKVDFSTLSTNIKTFESNCKTADKNVASAIMTLSGDFKKTYGIKDNIVSEFFNYLAVKVGNASAFGRAIKDGLNVVKDFLNSSVEKIKDWYKYKGGKYIVEAIAEGVAAALLAVLAVVTAGGVIVTIAAVILAVATVANGVSAVYNDIKAYQAVQKGDDSFAKRYANRDTLAETIKKESDSKFAHQLANAFEFIEGVAGAILLADFAINIGKGAVKLGSKLFGKNTIASVADDLVKLEDDAFKISEDTSDFKSVLSELDAQGYDEFLRRTDGIFSSESEAQEAFGKLCDRDFENYVKYFDFSSPEDGAVFWSKNVNSAENYSKYINGTIMENTQGGKVLNGWEWINKKFPTWDSGAITDAQPLWKSVSAEYASKVTGKVTYVHPDLPNGEGIGNVWKDTELPIVFQRYLDGLVTEIEEVFCNVKK